MAACTLIFYPAPYVGFNKTQLIERHLVVAGVLGEKLGLSSFYSAGQNFRQFIPRVESIHKYQRSFIRIQIQAVGVLAAAAGELVIPDCSNVVLVEGDIIRYPLDTYGSFCELLRCITGDQYQVDVEYRSIC